MNAALLALDPVVIGELWSRIRRREVLRTRIAVAGTVAVLAVVGVLIIPPLF